MIYGAGAVGQVTVETSNGRGFTPEEVAERALKRLIYVGSNSHPALREQALAFESDIRKVLVFYMHEVVNSHNVTIANRLTEAGHPELVKILGS